jgi:hypothetical protein
LVSCSESAHNLAADSGPPRAFGSLRLVARSSEGFGHRAAATRVLSLAAASLLLTAATAAALPAALATAAATAALAASVTLLAVAAWLRLLVQAQGQ